MAPQCLRAFTFARTRSHIYIKSVALQSLRVYHFQWVLRSEKELVRARDKYGKGRACKDCGQPTNSLSTRCDRCIEASYLVDELAYALDRLLENPRHPIGLAHDKRGTVHLVLFRSPHLAWCGARVTQVASKRELTRPGMFPPGVCLQCLLAYEVGTP